MPLKPPPTPPSTCPPARQVIAKAKVPIIKFEEAESGYNFDISFDVANGPEVRRPFMGAASEEWGWGRGRARWILAGFTALCPSTLCPRLGKACGLAARAAKAHQ